MSTGVAALRGIDEGELASLAEAISTNVPVRRFKPYPAYKDSGIEWLGEIPAHWDAKRLRFALALNPVASELRGIAADTRVSFVPMEAVGEYGGLDLSVTKPLAEVVSGYTYFRNGDIVIAKITPCFENGKGAQAADLENGIAFGTTELHVLRAGQSLDQNFLFYLTISDAFRRLGEAEMYGAGGQKRVPASYIENFRCSLPPLIEQRAIAAFLDRETARIDALVAKKEELIALLQEKRTALITRAVTKGLDPNAPMKDSGIEWLGEIPAHWEVKRLKHVTSKIGSGKTPSGGAEVYVSEGVMLLRSQNVHFSGLRLDDVAFIDIKTDSEMAGTRVKEGDVLLNITGASLGRCCIARLGGSSANVNQHVCVIRPKVESFDPAFLTAALASRAMQDQILNTENGISRDALNFEQISELWVACPTIGEQRVVASHIDNTSRKIEALIEIVRGVIAHLREFRTALISAAVTGKIDVRGEVA